MGADIHLHTEIKVNGVWHHYSQPRIGRSYALFTKMMAGVREVPGIEPVAEPRGLPEDLSFTTKLDADRWGEDGHSHSWLTGDELAEVLEWNDRRVRQETGQWFSSEHTFFGYLFGNSWRLYREERGESYPAEVEDVRAVFWFDN